ncbi:hypothetical protein E2C01_098782 [Portunus trituberculatus]|uniref:Uncharacterized protein n=1 Tax=Portunus trituberculatus TaxID=210409 RepID=A0A5B7KCZ3_PORTR|nr:hypothetical protein [Portunus trituberculatus]
MRSPASRSASTYHAPCSV